jgi:hypothetical protein
MKSTLTTLTAVILLFSSFTFSSCKDCGKKPIDNRGNNANTPSDNKSPNDPPNGSNNTSDGSTSSDNGATGSSSATGSDTKTSSVTTESSGSSGSKGSSPLTPQQAKDEVLANLNKLLVGFDKSDENLLFKILGTLALFMKDVNYSDDAERFQMDEGKGSFRIVQAYLTTKKSVLDELDMEYNHNNGKADDAAITESIRRVKEETKNGYEIVEARMKLIIADPEFKTKAMYPRTQSRPDVNAVNAINIGDDGRETLESGKRRRDRLIKNWNELCRLMPLADKALDDLIGAVKAHHQICGY